MWTWGVPLTHTPRLQARMEFGSSLAWLPVQGDLRVSLLRAGGLGASGDPVAPSTLNPGPNSGQKGKARGVPAGALDGLGRARPTGGQEEGRDTGSPAQPRPWQSPGSPQGTPGNGLRGLRGCARLPERDSVLGWAKNSRGMAGQGQPVGGSWGGAGGGIGWQPGPRAGRQWRWRTHPVPGGRPATAQLTGYFFPA